jgi:hypothetical protein
MSVGSAADTEAGMSIETTISAIAIGVESQRLAVERGRNRDIRYSLEWFSR